MIRCYKIFLIFIVSLMVFSQSAQAFEVVPQKVSEGVFAFIGSLNNRGTQNMGLNDNIGYVVTAKGVVLIDSGAGMASAKALAQGARKISNLPIIAVINTGSQDHRWLGNAYFKRHGAKIFALAKTVKTQKKMGVQLQTSLLKFSKSVFKEDDLVYAKHPFSGNFKKLVIGGVEFDIQYFADAHFPGDAVVWLPKQKVLFSGDLIFVDRLLGIHPWSNVISWQKAYHSARKLPAKWIVPGHGQICQWAKADQDTGAYLDKLIQKLSSAAENMQGVDQAVADNKKWPQFEHLLHYKTWHQANLNRAYLTLESQM